MWLDSELEQKRKEEKDPEKLLLYLVEQAPHMCVLGHNKDWVNQYIEGKAVFYDIEARTNEFLEMTRIEPRVLTVIFTL